MCVHFSFQKKRHLRVARSEETLQQIAIPSESIPTTIKLFTSNPSKYNHRNRKYVWSCSENGALFYSFQVKD